VTVDRYELALLLIGAAALLAAWLPPFVRRRPLSLPILLVGAGAAIGVAGLGLPSVDPRQHLELTERVSELVVIVALMGAGLKIDRPFSWRGWSNALRMVLIAMPLTIAAVALLGTTVAGLGVASAVLLGAAIAPTDPVLASDVQVGEPTLEQDEGEDAEPEDEVRVTLTGEGGMNDALAFPFVYLAVRMADGGMDPSDALEWLLVDVAWKVGVGVAIGLVTGWAVGIIAFRPPGPLVALSETPQGFLAVAATLLAYGGAEIVSAYGFMAVFVAAVALRSSERHHEFHRELHGFVEQVENLLVVGVLLVLGAAVAGGVAGEWWWQPIVVALLVVFVVRPLCGWVALWRAPLVRTERWTIAFFGVRGVGSVYYLAYGLSAASFAQEERLWSVVAAVLLVSILVHGVSATPAMQRVDEEQDRRSRWRPPFRRGPVA
jgi:NhaP-type Na+/H+ or K+/H+ antiporter